MLSNLKFVGGLFLGPGSRKRGVKRRCALPFSNFIYLGLREVVTLIVVIKCLGNLISGYALKDELWEVYLL